MSSAHRIAPLTVFDSIKPIISELRIFGGVTDSQLITILQRAHLRATGTALYNSLEFPALKKYPLLALFQEFLRENGAAAALMSGSGSSTFALVQTKPATEQLLEGFKSKFGPANWLAMVPC